MSKNLQRIAFLLLCIILLAVISTRVAPKEAMSTPEPTETPETEKKSQPVVIVVEPEESAPPAQLRELFPDLTLADWRLRLVNQVCVLPADFAPDVSKVREEQYFDSRAAEALETMIAAAEAEGYTVCLRAAYRPFSTQAYLFNGKASQIQWGTTMSLMDAETEARKVTAYPGTSEHQLGLAADLMDSANTTMDADAVRDLPLLVWLRDHCAEYGFILRYPESKTGITGWDEPWHFRYVGEEAAKFITDHGLCLEEFIELF